MSSKSEHHILVDNITDSEVLSFDFTWLEDH